MHFINQKPISRSYICMRPLKIRYDKIYFESTSIKKYNISSGELLNRIAEAFRGANFVCFSNAQSNVLMLNRKSVRTALHSAKMII